MGWVGWTEEQALSADVNAIEVAMRGKVAMLQQIFGGGDDDPAAVDISKLPEAGPGMFSRR